MFKMLGRKIRYKVRPSNVHLARLVPFKGQYAYEIQVGPLVIQWYHKVGRELVYREDSGGYCGTVGISHLRFWKDDNWLHAGRQTDQLVQLVLILVLIITVLVQLAPLIVALMINQPR